MTHQRRKILVIDDNADHLYVARELLSQEGYEVLTHQSPFGVTGLIQAAEPDLVLMDVNMPTLPGDDLAAFVRADERTRDVPIVLYSSNDERSLSLAAARHRLAGYICKGDVTELRMKVSFFLGDHVTDGSTFRRRLYAIE
ncbi:MAG: response regulator [Nitrospiraceae bacterium]|nr:response regulator [Nitrospiraceae bacterium]